MTPSTAQVKDGGTLQLTSKLMDQEGVAFNSAPAGVNVTWSSEDADVASVNELGIVAGKRPGTVKVTATAAGKSAHSTITVTPVAAELLLESGNEQEGEPGEALAEKLLVKVLDKHGDPIAGVAVTWSVTAGGGEIASDGPTDDDGLASATWSLGDESKDQSVRAQVAELPDSPVEFTANITEPLTYSENSVSEAMRTMTYHNGRYYNVFRDNSTGDYDIYLRSSTDGVNWTPKVRVSRSAEGKHESHPIVVAWGNGAGTRVAVSYEDRSDMHARLLVAVSTDGGETFQEPVAVSNHNDSKQVRGGIAVGADGVLYASWAREYGGDRWDHTFFSRSVDGGASWSTPVIAFNGDHYSHFNNIAAGDAGQVWIAIGDDQHWKQNIVVVRSSDGGATWSEAQITNHGSMWQAQSPALARAPDGSLHAVWLNGEHSKGPYRIFYSRSTTSGETWSTPVQVSDNVTVGVGSNIDYRQSPTIAIADDGRLYVVWSDDRVGPAPHPNNRNYDVYMATSTDNGATWSSDVRVNDASEVAAQDWASVAVGHAGAVIVWRDARDGTFTRLHYRVMP